MYKDRLDSNQSPSYIISISLISKIKNLKHIQWWIIIFCTLIKIQMLIMCDKLPQLIWNNKNAALLFE